MVPRPPICLFTVDLEDWFQCLHLRSVYPVDCWDSAPERLSGSVATLLDYLDTHRIRATFFVLGWIAERQPGLIRRIAARGHEIACHGYDHVSPITRSLDAFRQESVRALQVVGNAAQRPVAGYRAAGFGLDRPRLDIVRELGFRYDSSHHPFGLHDIYGSIAGLGEAILPDVYRVDGLWEIGLPVERPGGLPVPVGGGGYLRLLPGFMFCALARRAVMRRGHYVLYLHPWELDVGQPYLSGIPAWRRFRHYQSLHRTRARLDALASMLRRMNARFWTMSRFVGWLEHREEGRPTDAAPIASAGQ